MNHDIRALNAKESCPASVFAWILLASWNYYQQPCLPPLLSDTVFDSLCKFALENYDTLDHPFAKQYISKDDLRAGTLYALESYQYPLWCVRLAARLTEELEDKLKNG